jgi:hypothetical protein
METTEYSVTLTEQANPAFIRANRDLIIRYRDQLAQCSSAHARTELLKQLWHTEYGCRVVGSFERLEFDSNKRLSFYLLKWQ